ncbi:penicillin-binding protein 1C [Rhodoplanes sp. TEM]|uniref:peptidoglycan glycosyltransferase n=1 Tax=Rhodoplanes tepidamans TaxID=200616 RepID=A0ABT5JJ69_RHOTP|nr:penicillin-binding protein 1C [Rhodoplanes sp. TEM]MDC7789780.1 penicillin-binding protein 1C [Rhodoplanes tepidamans]MDC7987380.1 penicillin-binding protein 1C [Rhodoplanes sp. TEM]
MIAAVLVASALGAGALWVNSLGPPPLGKDLAWSTVVLDRDGRILRPYATPEGRWRLRAARQDVDPRFFELLLAYEDRRFRDHAGVDPRAFGRAALQLATNGRVVSGGSTLTMQVARLLEPRTERSLAAKLRQAVRAVQIERVLSKDEILGLYLSLAPYGGNLEGIRAASLAWFGKEPRRLTLGEAALLVALPQSPEARRPDRSPETARRARDRVLDRMAAAGVIEPGEIDRAKAEPVPTGRRPMPMLAPHTADRLAAEAPQKSLHRTTLEAPLQVAFEALAKDRAAALGPDLSVAVLAVEHATGEVLARVGSADWADARRAGQVDMTLAVRSPGSTLKPLIFGLGFEDGFLHPETLLDDRPVRYGAYAPENFDLTFQGTVTARKALQLSLNVPAVQVLDKIGPNRFAARIAQAGARLVLPPGEAPGLAMGLGGTGITLADLVRLYGGLARLGTTVPLAERLDEAGLVPPPEQTLRLLDPVAAWSVGNVLLGAPPPENAVGGRIAFKTGTSYGYRDAWAVGFDGRRTIGVWVGRPDGAPVPGMIGRGTAAPILFDAFARLGKPIAPLPPAPRGTLFASTGKLPLPLQRFRPGALPSAGSEPPLKIVFPPNGARLELAAEAGETAALAVKVAGGSGPVTVLMDGLPRATLRDRRTVTVTPDGPGFVRLTVTDSSGATDSVLVRVQ